LREADHSSASAAQAEAEADRAMVWLGRAVAAGYTNAAHLKQDSDLDALRDRADFATLVTQLESIRDCIRNRGGMQMNSSTRGTVLRATDQVQEPVGKPSVDALLQERCSNAQTPACNHALPCVPDEGVRDTFVDGAGI